MQLTIDASFWELFPTAQIGVLVVEGMDNTRSAAAAAALLQQAVTTTAAALRDVEMAAHPAVAPWRAAYAAFGAKPSKYRSSIEALLRSALSGRLGTVNPLVDLYNSVSLAAQLPAGGEDRDCLVGDLILTRAAGGEAFRTIGAESDDPPQRGEVIYRDDIGAVCRNWNWREADRTKLTEQTRNAVLVFEAVDSAMVERMPQALALLERLVIEHLGGRTRTLMLRRDNAAAALRVA